MIQEYLNSVDKFIVVGDRVLIKPRDMETRTKSGLVLPATVKEKESIHSGYVIKTGPGYPIPLPLEENEPWEDKDENVKYIPLQAKEGDLAIFVVNGSHEVIYEGEKYFIVPQNAILMLEREVDL